ncbi:toxin-activating lysine-acyltransferase [Salinarimonas rosea]|uniref:toxin-activating lysine-acyltransferase n=1 Tax=Salinarimonas rosea TaxID=552063 RepID=UPI000409E1B6|nr:toxin-activating lysine-acyltransferase [Salinarimonas rosea]
MTGQTNGQTNGHANGRAAETPAATPPADGAKPQASAEALAKIAEVRGRLLGAVGQVTLALAGLPRYRHQSLADLQSLVLEPLVRDRIAIATPRAGEGDESAEKPSVDLGALAGIAIWASVSPEVDAKIREQIKAGVFPVRLKPEDWASGDAVWLLDVIAPNQRLATSVLANFRQVAKGRAVLIHPVVARQVDREALEKLGARRADAPAAEDGGGGQR